MNAYAVIMAGGSGLRFWPLSTEERPKQLLSLMGGDTLINETIKRLLPVFSAGHIFIITNKRLAHKLNAAINPSIPRENVLLEPLSRNTAACVLNATIYIKQTFGEGIVFVFPSDHIIADDKAFAGTVKTAYDAAVKFGGIVTIGIKPFRPHTGYGYIKALEFISPGVMRGERFIEKPSAELAEKYVNSGQYLWNAGIFAFKPEVMLKLFHAYLPGIYEAFSGIYQPPGDDEQAKALDAAYRRIESVSIDSGIMENLNNFLVVPGEFKWSDAGSWSELSSILEPDQYGNILKGYCETINVHNCVVYNDTEIPVAVLGISDCIVVNTERGLLVCHKDTDQQVGHIAEAVNKTIEA